MFDPIVRYDRRRQMAAGSLGKGLFTVLDSPPPLYSSNTTLIRLRIEKKSCCSIPSTTGGDITAGSLGKGLFTVLNYPPPCIPATLHFTHE